MLRTGQLCGERGCKAIHLGTGMRGSDLNGFAPAVAPLCGCPANRALRQNEGLVKHQAQEVSVAVLHHVVRSLCCGGSGGGN